MPAAGPRPRRAGSMPQLRAVRPLPASPGPCASSARYFPHVHKEVMRMTKAMAGMGALLFMGVLAAGCEPMSKVQEPRQRAEAAATRAEDAESGRASGRERGS